MGKRRPSSGVAGNRIASYKHKRASMPGKIHVSTRYSRHAEHRPVATTKLSTEHHKNPADTSYDVLASEKWLQPTEASEASDPAPCELKVTFNKDS